MQTGITVKYAAGSNKINLLTVVWQKLENNCPMPPLSWFQNVHWFHYLLFYKNKKKT